MPFKNKRIRGEYHRKYNKDRRKLYRKLLLDLKKEIGKCEECSYDKHFEILQFHHEDKGEKLFRLSGGNIAYYNWNKILAETKRCKLICPNCHMWHHYQEKEWFIKQATNYSKSPKLKNPRKKIH